MDVLGIARGHEPNCFPDPRGGCFDSFPALSGPAALGGVSTETSDRCCSGASVSVAAHTQKKLASAHW